MYFTLQLVLVWYYVVQAFIVNSNFNKQHNRSICSPNNLSLDNLWANATWNLHIDGSLEVSLSHCRLRKFTGNEAKKCLKDNHLLFMGDSLSRYFYMSLTTLIATGHWSPRLSHKTNPAYRPSAMIEKDFNTWSDFHQFTNTMLNDPSTSSYELCDCFRDDNLSKFKTIL